MNASATFVLPDGREETLAPGDLVGRTWNAAIRFDDPGVSEAHAMLSLRGAQLWLLSLRRRLVVGGQATDAVALEVGQVIRLAPTVELSVSRVTMPSVVTGLEGPGLVAQALPGTCALVIDPLPRLVPGTPEGAPLTFWHHDGAWRARADGVTRPFVAGSEVEVDGLRFRGVAITLAEASGLATRADLSGPVRIVSRFDTVHIHRADGGVLVLAGQAARLVAELVSVGQPLAWEAAAASLWPDLDDRELLRRRWDVLLVRLRERLRSGGVRAELVSSTRVGLVELVLRQGDLVEDQS